jgi:hypothetical protein
MKSLALLALGSLGILGAGAGLSSTSDCSPCELVGRGKSWAMGLLGLNRPALVEGCMVLPAPAPPRELLPLRPPVAASSAPVVDRVEFRSAAVWAGACHYNGEYHHRGQGALLGFAFEAGELDGVDVAGLAAVVALGSEQNLDEATVRTAEAWIDANADAEQRAAVEAWLARQVGRLAAVHAGQVEVRVGPESFGLVVAGVAEAAADTLADRACCSMPENRWYEPLVGAPGAPVGYVDRCRFEGGEQLSGWTYEGENSAFLGLAPRP